MKNIAIRALNEILESDVENYIESSLEVSARVAIVGGSPVIEEITLTRTVGGPNVYVIVAPSRIVVEVWWGTQSYRLSYDGDKAKKIFDELEEIVRDMLRAAFC